MKNRLLLILPLLYAVAMLPSKADTLRETLATSRKIDALMKTEYKSQKVPVRKKIDDYTFVRRTYINIAGRIPSATEVKAFIKDNGKDKRYELIDRLIESDEFKGKMFLFYADLLRLKSNNRQHGVALHTYLYEAAHTNKPYDEMVTEMLSAEGHIAQNPAVGFMLRDEGMLLDSVADSVQVFLGTRIGCAQCHDHPFEDVTQLDFYKVAAFSGGVQYRASKTAREKIFEVVREVALKDNVNIAKMEADLKVGKYSHKEKGNIKKKLAEYHQKYVGASREVFKEFRRNELSDRKDKFLKLPHDYPYNDGKPHEIVKPGVFFGVEPKWKTEDDRRKAFAEWVTDDTNPMFAKVILNRLWANAFGYGLVEPLDDWTERTKTAHPKVLDFLVKEIKSNGYDLKQTMRLMYYTALFQREVVSDEPALGERHHFAGPLLRRMSAEELHDSMLTLERGAKINNKNYDIEKRWEEFVYNFNTVTNMSAEELQNLGESIIKVEKAIRELKLKRSKISLAINKAKANDEKALFDKLVGEKNEINSQIEKVYSNTMKTSRSETEGEPGSLESLMKFSTQGGIYINYKYSQYRASEKPQPAKAGGFIREFGGTDASVSDNGEDGGSVPQALEMLNGRYVKQIADQKGYLAELMKEEESARDKLAVLFISIYSRPPSAKEKALFRDFTGKPKQLNALFKAMINSKNFIFVQ